jgi:hypothetical protein
MGVARAQPWWWARMIPLHLLLVEQSTAMAVLPSPMVQNYGLSGIDAYFYPNTYHIFDHRNLPVTVLTNIKLRDGHSPSVGSNVESRADAIECVTQFLAKQLP